MNRGTSGIMSGWRTGTSITGSSMGGSIGSRWGGIAFFFLDFFFPVMRAASAAKTQHARESKRSHFQTAIYEPEEPEAAPEPEPLDLKELERPTEASDPPEALERPTEASESLADEAELDADESHGVTVVAMGGVYVTVKV